MMTGAFSSLSAEDIVILFGLLPFVFAGFVAVCRRGAQRSGGLDERAERIILLLMLAPFASGLLLAGFAGALPSRSLPLPFGGWDMGGGLASEEVSTSAAPAAGVGPSLWSLSLIAYGLVSAVFLARIAKGWRTVRHVLRSSVPAPQFGPDVAVTEMAVPPFAGHGGVIVLPSSIVRDLSPAALDLVIRHERAHHRAHDPMLFTALAVLDAVCWANPFIRHQTVRVREAAERRCDAAALLARPAARRLYAETLIHVMRTNTALRSVPTLFATSRKDDRKMRLTEILHPKSPAPGARRRARVVLVAASTALLPLGVWQASYAAMGGNVTFTVRPVEGRLTSSYGPRTHPVTGEPAFHNGTDIAAPAGTEVLAPAAGTVTVAAEWDRYGNVMEIDHGDGIVTRYAQLQGFEKAVGDKVAAGDLVARVGSSGQSTGPHLHVEVFIDGERVDPATQLDLPSLPTAD